MKHLLCVFIPLAILSSLPLTTVGFTCSKPNGRFVNPDDYRSYYTCSNNCYSLEYCPSPKAYFSRTDQVCAIEPTDWQPRFDLSGQFRSDATSDVFVRQDGYNVYMKRDTSAIQYTVIARYVNITSALGLATARQTTNNCVVVFNIHIVATNNKAFCYYETIHPYSSHCDLPVNYSGNYCKT